jgi:hypothetical protein
VSNRSTRVMRRAIKTVVARCGFSIVTFLIVTISTVRPAAGQDPYCPSAPYRDVFISGTTVGGGQNNPMLHSILTYPCETFQATVTATEQHPLWSLDLNVELQGADAAHTLLTSKSLTVNTTATATLPPDGSSGNPLPNTAHLSGQLGLIKVWSQFASATYPVSYSIAVHLEKRASNYNTGGQGFADARGPILSGSQVQFSLRVGPGSPKTYYRVTLKPGGTLTLSGTATNAQWSYATALYCWIYNSAQQLQSQILAQNVPSNSSHNPLATQSRLRRRRSRIPAIRRPTFTWPFLLAGTTIR